MNKIILKDKKMEIKKYTKISTLAYGVCDIVIIGNTEHYLSFTAIYKDNKTLANVPTSNLHNILTKSGYKTIYPNINPKELNRIYSIRESIIQSAILNYLDNLDNTYAVRVKSSGKTGDSDIVFCHKGRFVAIEVKRNTTKGGKIQNRRLISVMKAGGVGEVVRSLTEVKEIITKLDCLFRL